MVSGTVVEQIYKEREGLGYSVDHRILFVGRYSVPQMACPSSHKKNLLGSLNILQIQYLNMRYIYMKAQKKQSAISAIGLHQ